jgi:hypothetical protein
MPTDLHLRYLIQGTHAGARDCDCPCNPCDCDPCECNGATRLPRWRLSCCALTGGHLDTIPLTSQQVLLSLALPLAPDQTAAPAAWQELILADLSIPEALLLPLLTACEHQLESLPAEVRARVERPRQRAVYRIPLSYRQEGSAIELRAAFAPREAHCVRQARPARPGALPAWSYAGPLALRGTLLWRSA